MPNEKGRGRHGLGAEDGVGQIVTIDGVRYRHTATGRVRLDGEEAPALDPWASMADPALAGNPTGNPYKK